MSNSLGLYRLSPARLLCPWDSQAKILEWVAAPSSRDGTLISFLLHWHAVSLPLAPPACKGRPSQSYSFSSGHVWMWELDYKESWAPKIWCFWTVVLEKTLESPMNCKEIQSVHHKGDQSWCWSWSANTLATWCEELTHLKRLWCWERLRAGGEGDDRRWDGWMASPTQWTWVWVNSGSWWWTGKSGVLLSMGLQKSQTIEQLNWTDAWS